LDVSCF